VKVKCLKCVLCYDIKRYGNGESRRTPNRADLPPPHRQTGRQTDKQTDRDKETRICATVEFCCELLVNVL
jgi:hypothetical protein